MIDLLALLASWFAGVPSWTGAVRNITVASDGVTVRFAATERFHGGGKNGGLRVVLDVSIPAIVAEHGGKPSGPALTLALRTADDARFASAAAEGRMRFLPPFSYFRLASHHGYSVSMAVPPPARNLPLPEIAGPEGRPLVVIDAGHGGHDPGALSPNGAVQEKDLTLKVALAIRDALLAGGRVRVAMTRDDDRFLVLQERYGIARRLGGNLFISVHCDSAGNLDAAGATAYTLSEIASDKEAARLAARENKADIIAGVDLGDAPADISSILIDLAQRETMTTSAGFAQLLGREAGSLIPTRPNFHRMASLMVLKAPDMPSILFETGYISNQRDAASLSSPAGRAKVAESVRRAVEIHFATQLTGRSGTATPPAGR